MPHNNTQNVYGEGSGHYLEFLKSDLTIFFVITLPIDKIQVRLHFEVSDFYRFRVMPKIILIKMDVQASCLRQIKYTTPGYF